MVASPSGVNGSTNRLVIGEPADLFLELCKAVGDLDEIVNLLKNLRFPAGGGGGIPPWTFFNPLIVTVNAVAGVDRPQQLTGANPNRVPGLWIYNQSAAQVTLVPNAQADPTRVGWILGPGVTPLYLPGYLNELWAVSSVPNSPVSVLEGMP